jgi:L-fucose mutarotase
MLKSLDPLLTPELLAMLARMGHGDVIAVVDRNYPAAASGRPVIELPGVDGTAALRAILQMLPVDTFQDPAAWHMLADDGSPGPAVHSVQKVLDEAEGRPVSFAGMARQRFYERTPQAMGVVRTGDDRPYACFLIAKGVVA